MFSGLYWNQPLCTSIPVSVYVQNTSFCQSAHLVTALVHFTVQYREMLKVKFTGYGRDTWDKAAE